MDIFTTNETLTVAVATENKGKLAGVNRALTVASTENSALYILHAANTASGVSDTPLSDEEGIIGCSNRLKELERKNPDMDLYIALEGVMAQVGTDWFIRGWTKVKHTSSGRVATASGAAVQIPSKFHAAINHDQQFSLTLEEIYDANATESGSIRKIGANGLFTQGEYARNDSFYDGIRICLAHIQNDRNW